MSKTNTVIKIALIFTALFLLVTTSTQASVVHRIEPGDSLYKIAGQYGSTVDKIVSHNNLENPNLIFPRQVLIIPPIPGAIRYTVQSGDSLYSISRRFNSTLQLIIDRNNVTNPNLIYPGQVLIIPIQAPPSPPSQQPGESDEPDPEYLERIRNLRELRRDYPDHFRYSGNNDSKQVALTFDDGPDSAITPEILDILKNYGVTATFFVIGRNIEGNEAVMERIINEGHSIGHHSWTHDNLRQISMEQVIEEIDLTEEEVQRVTGKDMSVLRPPYGDISREALEYAISKGYTVVNWSVDSRDWQTRNVDTILINTLPDIERGAIILMHSYGPQLRATADSLPELIYTLQVQGYEFVSVEDIL